MNPLLKLVQGSPEWHAHRSRYRNASESAAVMGFSPWTTAYALWLIRTGRKVITENAAMRHGTAMEAEARLAFELDTALIMQPQVMTDGLYSASLDGITLDGATLVEIKCPFKGQASELWQSAAAGEVPEHYRIQIQHQLMVSKAQLAYLWVFDGEQGIRLPIEPDPAMAERIRHAWGEFQFYLDSDSPPPLAKQDTVQRTDMVWQQAAQEYLGWKSVVEEAQAKADKAKARLIALTSHGRESGYGVCVTRYWKQGSVDYKRVPELEGVDLTLYRGDMREEVRVTIS